jgi:hypothetical protein
MPSSMHVRPVCCKFISLKLHAEQGQDVFCGYLLTSLRSIHDRLGWPSWPFFLAELLFCRGWLALPSLGAVCSGMRKASGNTRLV